MNSQIIENLQSASDFCRQCGNLIELTEVADIVECIRCGYQVPYSSLNYAKVLSPGIRSETNCHRHQIR